MGRYNNGSARTCQNCAAAKIRCIRPDGNGSCNRCHRLGKDCHFREGRGLASGNQGNPNRRLDVLEARMDQILAQLSPSQESSAGRTPQTMDTDTVDVIDRGLLTMQAAQTLFNEFRTTLMPYCPFVVIPPEATAEAWRKDRPFLFLAILTAGLYDNMPMQRTMEKEVKKMISHHMIFDGSISFDLLQGLLVHITWCQYHARPRRFSQYLHLAIGIITDLQLDRAPELRFWRTRVNFDDTDKGSLSWGREERRAVAGCFYFSSSVSQILQKRCSFSYIPYIEDSCRSLALDAEFSSDKMLLYLVRLQHLSEKMTCILSQSITNIHLAESAIEDHFQSLKSELELYRSTLPFALHESHIIFMQFHTSELYLCQVSLFDHKPGVPRQEPTTSFRIAALCMGLSAAKSLLEFYITLPLRAEMAFNNTGWIQIGFALTLACKLAIAAMEPSVQQHAAELCRSLDLSNLLSRCILRVQALITSNLDALGDRDAFYHYEKRLKRVQWWYESRKLATPGPSIALSHRPGQSDRIVDPTTPATGATNAFLNEPGANNGLNSYAQGAESSTNPDAFDVQWPGFFPDITIDQMFDDWMNQATISFEPSNIT